MKTILISLTLILTGCGATATKESPERTEYVMVSQGNASFLYSAFMGGVDYCKVTRHRDEKAASNALSYTIIWEDGKCQVEAVK